MAIGSWLSVGQEYVRRVWWPETATFISVRYKNTQGAEINPFGILFLPLFTLFT